MKLSIVTTVYYSENLISEFYKRMVLVVRNITSDYEFIIVNDGSPDKSKEEILKLQIEDPCIMLIDLTRNFGHHKALMTGLSYAEGDYVFMIDSDLEEDPELLYTFWNELKKNKESDVIYGIQKTRKGNWFERLSGKVYYSIFSSLTTNNYPPNTITARLMSSKYVCSLKLFTEKEADLWGLFLLNGYIQKGVLVTKAYKGSSTYNLRRKIKVAISTITTLTHKPLYFILIIGIVATFFGILSFIYILIRYFSNEAATWEFVFASVWLVGGLALISLGVISVYLGKMLLEVKNRPLSIVRKIYKTPS